jgi:X-domain of DnaJ-containing
VGRDWQCVRNYVSPSFPFLFFFDEENVFCRLSVQQVMQDIERAQSKGDTSEEELKALEYDVTGKIMLASWRGTRFEVVQVLREVRPVSHLSLFLSVLICKNCRW